MLLALHFCCWLDDCGNAVVAAAAAAAVAVAVAAATAAVAADCRHCYFRSFQLMQICFLGHAFALCR